MYPKFIKIVDVSPHDGFQNEPELVTTETKVTLIHMLLNCGLKIIESGAFVSPKCVQKMADSAEVFANRKRKSDVAFSALTPNMKGLVSAMIASVKEVAVFAAASEPFSKKNTNFAITECIDLFSTLCDAAKRPSIAVRVFISCALGCPYERDVSQQSLLN